MRIKWATTRENVSSGVCDQVTFKPTCSATETSYNLETLDIASIHIILSKQRTTKVLIRLRECAGWSAPLLFAYGIRRVFAWPGPNGNILHVFTAVEFNASHPADWIDPLNWCPTDTEGGTCKQLTLLDSEKIPCRTDDVVFPTGSSYYISLGSGLNLNVRTLKLSGKVNEPQHDKTNKMT